MYSWYFVCTNVSYEYGICNLTKSYRKKTRECKMQHATSEVFVTQMSLWSSKNCLTKLTRAQQVQR